MKIIVFGGSGFLGSHTADTLLAAGHEVIIFDLNPSLYAQPVQTMVVGDIRDRQAVLNATVGVDVVYNFAGVVDIELAKDKPYETIEANIIGTTNILEACRYNRIQRFVFASTVYVYSEAGSFYRASKQACELIIESYHKEYGIDFTILRYGSLYGPRSSRTNWIFNVLSQALSERKITRYGDGSEIREYIHIYDAARLSVKILQEEFRNQYVIISGNQPIEIRNLMTMVKEMLNNEIELEFASETSNSHYEITPYNFRPKLAKRLVDSTYVDLGQGILDLLSTMSHENAAINKEIQKIRKS